MPTLYHPKSQSTTNDLNAIKKTLEKYNVEIDIWETPVVLYDHSTEEDILIAYEHKLKSYMDKKGFKSADVINVTPKTEGLSELRNKFIKEHTHSEDEVRFFVDGEGLFWFHFDDSEVYSLTCRRGDFISVPKNYRHWFDLHPQYFVKAIRIFSNKEGWKARYTESNIHEAYLV